jgi:beta-D-xylosidase 4
LTMLRLTLAAALLAATSNAQVIAGDNLALWTCGAIPGRQAFVYNTQSGNLVNHILVNGSSNLVFDLTGPSNASGTVCHVWGPYAPPVLNQEWTMQGSPLQIKTSYATDMCVASQGLFMGSPIVINPCNASDPQQQWTYDATSLTFSIASVPTLCMQAGAAVPSCDIPPFSTYPYCNPALPIAQRVADLVGRMTTAEKSAALDSGIPALPRLGLPSMHSGEALHGAATGCFPANGSNTGCPTSFPCPTALGATFDSDLWQDVGQAIGYEARALYNGGIGAVWVFAPNINPGRAPQWGRNQEIPGEDPNLLSSYAASFISGLQGANASDPRYLLVASTAKHFVAYDLEGFIPRVDVQPRPPTALCDTPGGCQRWNFDALPLARDLNGFYALPFMGALGVGVRSFMCAYSGINQQPSCGSDLMQQLLRSGSWDGHIVSDCTAIELMQDATWNNCVAPDCIPGEFMSHNFTHTVVETANVALQAGTDVNCGPFYNIWLNYLVNNGSVAESLVDAAVTRVYTTAAKLGLMDPSAGQIYPNLPPSTVDSPEHRALALKAAQESIVLLKNDPVGTAGAPLLPLKNLGAGLKLAFIGPHANSTQDFLANYHGSNTLVNSHSPLMVAQSRGLDVTFAQGCNICDTVPPGFPNMPCTVASNVSGIPAAVAAAAAADVAILFVGSDQTTEAENFDRDTITLAGVQETLVLAVIAAQPNTIVVFINGGVVSSPNTVAKASSIVEAFYGGELAADAILDVLTGVVSPAGRLPLTLYYPNITTRDIRNMDLAADGGITHMYFQGPVLYPFGWGLSYTSFETSSPVVHLTQTLRSSELQKLAADASSLEETIGSLDTIVGSVEVTVRNSGERASDYVLLGFVSPPEDARSTAAFANAPLQQLFGFTRLHDLQPTETRTVALPLKARFLGYFTDPDGMWAPIAGVHRVRIGDAHVEVKLE